MSKRSRDGEVLARGTASSYPSRMSSMVSAEDRSKWDQKLDPSDVADVNGVLTVDPVTHEVTLASTSKLHLTGTSCDLTSTGTVSLVSPSDMHVLINNEDVLVSIPASTSINHNLIVNPQGLAQPSGLEVLAAEVDVYRPLNVAVAGSGEHVQLEVRSDHVGVNTELFVTPTAGLGGLVFTAKDAQVDFLRDVYVAPGGSVSNWKMKVAGAKTSVANDLEVMPLGNDSGVALEVNTADSIVRNQLKVAPDGNAASPLLFAETGTVHINGILDCSTTTFSGATTFSGQWSTPVSTSGSNTVSGGVLSAESGKYFINVSSLLSDVGGIQTLAIRGITLGPVNTPTDGYRLSIALVPTSAAALSATDRIVLEMGVDNAGDVLSSVSSVTNAGPIITLTGTTVTIQAYGVANFVYLAGFAGYSGGAWIQV